MDAAVLWTIAAKDVGHFEPRLGGSVWSHRVGRREHVSGSIYSIHRAAVSSNAGPHPPPHATYMRDSVMGGRVQAPVRWRVSFYPARCQTKVFGFYGANSKAALAILSFIRSDLTPGITRAPIQRT